MCGVRIELPGGGEIKNSTGSNPIGDVGNAINREASNAVNATNRILSDTGNAINSVGSDLNNGFNNIGQTVSDGVLRAINEIVGELDGTNKQRAQDAADQIVKNQIKEADRLRQEEIERNRQTDINASNAAGASQRRSIYAAGSAQGVSNQAFNNLTKDFLGL